MMINLRQETLSVLSKNNKSWDDVVGICGDEFQITKDEFLKLSNVEYDNDYGDQMVAEDLKIVGKDFWLERYDYDGKEGWHYKEIPNLSNKPFISISKLVKNSEEITIFSLKEYNNVNAKVVSIELQELHSSIIKCPKCGESYYTVMHGMTTAAYYPPVYKDGVNINPDRNKSTTHYRCCNCGNEFDI